MWQHRKLFQHDRQTTTTPHMLQVYATAIQPRTLCISHIYWRNPMVNLSKRNTVTSQLRNHNFIEPHLPSSGGLSPFLHCIVTFRLGHNLQMPLNINYRLRRWSALSNNRRRRSANPNLPPSSSSERHAKKCPHIYNIIIIIIKKKSAEAWVCIYSGFCLFTDPAHGWALRKFVSISSAMGDDDDDDRALLMIGSIHVWLCVMSSSAPLQSVVCIYIYIWRISIKSLLC